jgi:hypothetical protein
MQDACMYVRTYTCIQVDHTRVHVCIWTLTHMHIDAHTHAYTHACTCRHAGICIQMHAHTRTDAHKQAYISFPIAASLYIYIQTYITCVYVYKNHTHA